MASKQVPPKPEQQPQHLNALAKRVFSRSNEDGPEPVYTNAVEFASMGMDVFMDVGVVSPESVAAALAIKSGNQPTVNVLVNFRFGMSLQTAVLMQRKLTEMLQGAQAQMAATMPTSGEKGTTDKDDK
jgi:hypothetical protein